MASQAPLPLVVAVAAAAGFVGGAVSAFGWCQPLRVFFKLLIVIVIAIRLDENSNNAKRKSASSATDLISSRQPYAQLLLPVRVLGIVDRVTPLAQSTLTAVVLLMTSYLEHTYSDFTHLHLNFCKKMADDKGKISICRSFFPASMSY